VTDGERAETGPKVVWQILHMLGLDIPDGTLEMTTMREWPVDNDQGGVGVIPGHFSLEVAHPLLDPQPELLGS
jgi:hypothetical protein